MEVEICPAEFNAPYVDFWPLIKRVRIVYAAACWALFWSCVATPVALVLRFGLTDHDLPGISVFGVHATWRIPLVWAGTYVVGFLIALPHVLWLAMLERTDPSGRVAFMVRSVKIGLVYGVPQAIGAWLYAGLRVGHLWHVWPLAVAFYLAAFVCGYIVGRVEAKEVPIE